MRIPVSSAWATGAAVSASPMAATVGASRPQRRQDGRQPHDQDQQGEDPGRLAHPHAVVDHGAVHHHAGAAPEALQEPADDQHRQAIRQGTSEGGGGEKGVTEIEGRLATKAVAEGAIGQLSKTLMARARY